MHAKIPEKGDFGKISSPSLLLYIAESGLTGILYVKQEETLKALHFDGGRLVWAISNSVEDKLERILLEGRLVDELTLNRLRRQQSGTALGKSLVEKGLLSVEQLVECTRLQFKRILDDVLAWTRGGFQVIESPPPENLFKMDLDMVSMVFNYVLENVSLDQVHQRIPDLSVRPQSRADEERIQAFNLSQKKREFLTHFNGGQSVEEILSRYADSHRDALLKVVYFFLLADLVRLPHDPGPFDSQDIEVQQPAEGAVSRSPFPGLDMEAEGIESAPTSVERDMEVPEALDAPESLLDLDVESAEPAPDFYSFADGLDRDREQDLIGLSSNPDFPGAEDESPGFTVSAIDENALEPDFPVSGAGPAEVNVDDMIKRETRQGRQLNLLLLMIVAILVTGGSIFLLLTSGHKDIPATVSAVKKETHTEKKPASPPVDAEKRTRSAEAAVSTASRGDHDPVTRPAGTGPRAERQASEKKPVPAVAGNDSPPAAQLLRSGRYLDAARVWRTAMSGNMNGFSILLELDCLTASVAAAFKRIHEPEKFFLLPRDRDGRTCFLVMWGRFNSQAEAEKALSGLPAYFRRQDPPAKVVDLAAYR